MNTPNSNGPIRTIAANLPSTPIASSLQTHARAESNGPLVQISTSPRINQPGKFSASINGSSMRLQIGILIGFLIICLGCSGGLLEPAMQTQAPAAPQYDTGYPNGIWPGGVNGNTSVIYGKFVSTLTNGFVFQKDFDRSTIPSLFVSAMNRRTGRTAYAVADGGTLFYQVNITFNCDPEIEHLGAYVEVYGRSSAMMGQPGTSPAVKWFSFTLPQNYVTYTKLLDDAGTKAADFMNNGWH